MTGKGEELRAFERMLARQGFDPVHAQQLLDEGMKRLELEVRVAILRGPGA